MTKGEQKIKINELRHQLWMKELELQRWKATVETIRADRDRWLSEGRGIIEKASKSYRLLSGDGTIESTSGSNYVEGMRLLQEIALLE